MLGAAQSALVATTGRRAGVCRKAERWCAVERPCVAFADGQAMVLGGGKFDSPSDVLAAFFELARRTLRQVREWAGDKAVFRRGRIEVGAPWSTVCNVHSHLREKHPIRVESGFEGNPGVEGGVWRPADQADDGLVHLRFSAETEDLPLHIHEFSDRLIVVTSGIGVFHYMPDGVSRHELCSLVVESDDVLIFTRGLIHTFTAPIDDLTLLSYHSPFFELDDPRQYTIPPSLRGGDWAWAPEGVVRIRKANRVMRLAPAHDIAAAVR